MDDHMTKAKLLDEMRTTRVELNRLISELDDAHMTQPGTVGDWSIKDVIFHCTSYARSFVRQLQAHLRGKPPPLDETEYATEYMGVEERNQLHFQQSQERPLKNVLAESRQVFEQLIELTAAHSEEFLIQPQQFEGVPVLVVVWKQLEHVCEHYRGHMQSIRAGLEKSADHS